MNRFEGTIRFPQLIVAVAERQNSEIPRAGTAEIVGLGEVRWVLPQTLRALVPGRVMEDGIAASDRSFLRTEWFPRNSDARL